MKKAFAVVLATVLIVCALLPASAATQAQKRVVYVASQDVPKAAADYARNWFSNRMYSQDICDISNLAVEKVKDVRLCRGFRVEYMGSTEEKYINYIFPLIYEDIFIGALLVMEHKKYGYQCQIYSGYFIEWLNALPSSPAAPLMFVQTITDSSSFVVDSKNKVKHIFSYPRLSDDAIKRKIADVRKMQKPSGVVQICADTAYPEQIPPQRITPRRIAAETLVLTVKDETNKLIYKSHDGGKTWANNFKPPVYISIDRTFFPKKHGEELYTVYNNTAQEISTGRHFTLQRRSGKKWVKCPEADELDFTDDALIIPPKGSLTLHFDYSQLYLNAIEYKLITKEVVDNRQFTCETVFFLM